MPPVTKAGGQQFRKDVEFVTKDDDEQVAAGIVMVPDKADLQNDFAREDTIRTFADQFEAFVDAGEAGGGIMHAVFPSEWMELERNEVLDESEEIGGQTVDAGAWVQEWAINHGDLWELILEDIISGYSIGAIQVAWNGPFEQDELDDVEVPDELGDELVWELVEGIIREVSAVDIPAVPDAQILDTKAAAEKRLGDYLGDPNGFVEEAMERGHSEDDAELLWDVLNEAADVDGADTPGKESSLTRAAKSFLSSLMGGDVDDPSGGAVDEDTRAKAEAIQSPAEVASAAKEGRTLSTQNRHSLMASIDAAADVLEDAGVDHSIERFTDRSDVDFDLSEHDARDWSSSGDGDDEGNDDDDEDEDDDQSTDNAAGGDTPDDGGADAADADPDTDTTMSDDDNGGDDKSLAEKNAEQISELSESVKGLTEALTGPEPKTAEIEIGGETHEVPEERLKEVLGLDKNADGDDVVSAIESLQDEVNSVEQRLDTVARQSGGSTQVEAAANGEGEENDGLGALGKALN